MTRLRLSLALTAALSTATLTFAADPAVEALLPVSDDARKILDNRCVLCHGEMIDGEAEIREDLDLSTDEKIRETLTDVKKLIEVIANDEMPHDGKLSFRLRKRPDMQERLKTIKAEYEANGEKEPLMKWLAAAEPHLPKE